MEVEFTARAQRFVRSAVLCVAPWGLAFGELCFRAVGCGRDVGVGVSGCCIEPLFGVVQFKRCHWGKLFETPGETPKTPYYGGTAHDTVATTCRVSGYAGGELKRVTTWCSNSEGFRTL